MTYRVKGGISREVKKSKISLRRKMGLSLMPQGLTAAISAQELVDVVHYLQALKKARR